jgi:curli biogenesis system outer membrane secretion channel CsgG
MKKYTGAFIFLLLTFVFISGSLAADKPRLGVLRFTNNTHAGWWHGTAGEELQDMLIAELASTKAFTVLERKEINAVISEQKLGASGLVTKGTGSAVQEQTGGQEGGFSFMGVSIGGDKGSAYIAVDLKVIDTNTGEIADVRTVEATSESSGMRVGLNLGFFSGNLGDKAKTPTGKAIRGCIVEISTYLECSLLQGKDSSCMKEFDAKESKRRQTTRDAIKLQ